MIAFFKALHVVGFVSWFAGLFYLVRIFVYHAEAQAKTEPERSILSAQFLLMCQRVYRIIATPALWITWIAGLFMLLVDWIGADRRLYFEMGSPGWMVVKLALLAGLTAYHFYCRYLLRRIRAGAAPQDPFKLRLLNEGPTLFLVTISFVAVYGKAGTLNYSYLLIGVAAFAALVYAGALAYRKKRMNNNKI